ncbi:MAG: trigger factor [Clostridia bacterium]|nr:trigger factor [Clostridia bacterium]
MKLVNTEKKEHSTVELSIAVSPETFEKSVERAYKKKVGTINLPGFRKGKAPRKMIESMYGKEVFFEEAMNICYPEAFSFAVKEAGLEPVGYPNLTDFNIDDAGEFTFKAVVAVKPEAELAAYKGLKAEKDAPVITDEDVDREVARMAERNARLVEVERPLANGDVAEFDFDGYVDGVAFDGGKAEHYSLKIGSGMFIPGFEEQMVGKTIGEAFDVNVTFPEEYQEQSLAGKPAVFKCKLHGIKESQQPVLDDEFAKDVSEFDTLDALKADLKAKLTENNVFCKLLNFRQLEAEQPLCGILHHTALGGNADRKPRGNIDADILARQRVFKINRDGKRRQIEKFACLQHRPYKGRATVNTFCRARRSVRVAAHLTVDDHDFVGWAAFVAREHEQCERECEDYNDTDRNDTFHERLSFM